MGRDWHRLLTLVLSINRERSRAENDVARDICERHHSHLLTLLALVPVSQFGVRGICTATLLLVLHAHARARARDR